MAVGELNIQLLYIILAVIIGTLAAIVYSLRVLVLMERRIARIEMHIEHAVGRVAKEEFRIEKRLGSRRGKKRR